ncbi:MAG TPA: hypothetical protein C5S51_07870 [Methanosarcinaceae archaeon]|nr:hypothetical protein [Methanosarcinaceae archaeon]
MKDFLISPEFENLSRDEIFAKRSNKAINLVKHIMERHKKGEISTCIADLAKYELKIRHLNSKHRDHVVHTMFTFILGIYINETYMKKLGVPVNPLQWKIACLFHDIGYLGNDLISSSTFEEKVDNIKSDYLTEHNQSLNNHLNVIDVVGSTTENIPFKISDVNVGKLKSCKNSFELIEENLKLDREINLRKEYLDLYHENIHHHGMIGSLAVLSIIDLMYYTNNPCGKCNPTIVVINNVEIDFNQRYFNKDIIPACSAIYIHSLESEWFEKHTKINCSKAPVAFLLRLSDCLQEWGRPSGDNDGFDSEVFKIKFNGSDLIFNVNIHDNVEKMKK